MRDNEAKIQDVPGNTGARVANRPVFPGTVGNPSQYKWVSTLQVHRLNLNISEHCCLSLSVGALYMMTIVTVHEHANSLLVYQNYLHILHKMAYLPACTTTAISANHCLVIWLLVQKFWKFYAKALKQQHILFQTTATIKILWTRLSLLQLAHWTNVNQNQKSCSRQQANDHDIYAEGDHNPLFKCVSFAKVCQSQPESKHVNGSSRFTILPNMNVLDKLIGILEPENQKLGQDTFIYFDLV